MFLGFEGQSANLNPVAVLRRARLPVTLHLDTRRLVSTAQLFALWTAMLELAGILTIGSASSRRRNR